MIIAPTWGFDKITRFFKPSEDGEDWQVCLTYFALHSSLPSLGSRPFRGPHASQGNVLANHSSDLLSSQVYLEFVFTKFDL